jgi:hypothetical protein
MAANPRPLVWRNFRRFIFCPFCEIALQMFFGILSDTTKPSTGWSKVIRSLAPGVRTTRTWDAPDGWLNAGWISADTFGSHGQSILV